MARSELAWRAGRQIAPPVVWGWVMPSSARWGRAQLHLSNSNAHAVASSLVLCCFCVSTWRAGRQIAPPVVWGWVMPSSMRRGRAELSPSRATRVPFFSGVFRPLSLQLRLKREIFGAHSRQPQFLSSAQRSDAVTPAVDLSDAEADIRFELQTDWAHHAREPDHCLIAAAGDRHLHGPPPATTFARRRHGVHARRDGAARIRAELRGRTCGRRAHRARFRRFPSRIVPHRAARIGRAPRVRPGIFSGGRQCGIRSRSAARRVSRAAVRAPQHRLVFAWRRSSE